MTCFACDREPTQQCPRCGRPYCDEHGEEFCDACLSPVSGLPSFTLYRGSLLALLIGTALAVWLLVQPSGSSSAGLKPIVLTPTTVAQVQPSQAPAGNGTVVPIQSPVATTRPATTPGNATPTGPTGTQDYTVVSGDTLSTICTKVKPASMTLQDCIDRIVALNSLSDSSSINVGQKLIVPK